MSTKHLLPIVVTFAWLTASNAVSAPIGQPTIYQGYLSQGGMPAAGAYDFSILLFDAGSGGSQIGAPLVVSPLVVSNGLFAVPLDFATETFDGNARWMEISVRTNGIAATYTKLLPRQPIGPTPYSIFSSGAASLLTGGNEPLLLKVNNLPAFRIEPTSATPNLIGGFSGNDVASGLLGAVIAGGGANQSTNRVLSNYGTVGGGMGNVARGFASAINGGWGNTAGDNAAVGGGAFNSALEQYCTIGGGSSNVASAIHATVCGGTNNVAGNIFAFVGGGKCNVADGCSAAIAGGFFNANHGECAVLGGGDYNLIDGGADYAALTGGERNAIERARYGTISGGFANQITTAGFGTIAGGGRNLISTNSFSATIGGGSSNQINTNAPFGTIPGGDANYVGAIGGFAAGHRAKANHQGSFVWGDWTDEDVTTDANNQFVIRATGGVKILSASGPTIAGVQLPPGGGAWSSLSDRASKRRIVPVDGRQILDKVATIPISTWNYKSQDQSVRHIGPMAQDFAEVFGVGEDNRHISTVDADGVALASIQALNQIVTEQERELETKARQIKNLERRLSVLENLLGHGAHE